VVARLREDARMPLHPQVKTLLDGFAQAGGKPMSEVSVDEARNMLRMLASLDQPEDVARVDDRLVPGPGGDVPVRVYTPGSAIGVDHGVFVWIHGGGWVIGDLETADATCRALANRAEAVVVSIDYRRAPEHPAPAAIEDCAAVLRWVAENGETLGADVSKLAVGGDSAGGNLAALLCQRVRDEFGPAIDFQLLVYPVTDLTLTHPSIIENGEGYFLTRDTMEWFVGHYLQGGDATDPVVSPLHAESLADLPPALVITAEFDPLRDEGEAYAAKLLDAGVPTELIRYDGQIHGFFAMTAMLEDAVAAVDHAGAALHKVLA
jgi:acetyl esterase